MNEAEQGKTPAQGIWCGKMCPELSAPTKEPISASCSKKPQKWPANKPPLFLSLKTDGLPPDASPMWEDNGALLGEYLMHSFGACPKDENASHLSQILEASPHPKYSLSAKACLGILRRAENRGKVLPEILKRALIQQAQRGGAYCIQGNCIDRADTAGCNGKGWTEGISYTLNTIDRPAVLPFVPAPQVMGGLMMTAHPFDPAQITAPLHRNPMTNTDKCHTLHSLAAPAVVIRSYLSPDPAPVLAGTSGRTE